MKKNMLKNPYWRGIAMAVVLSITLAGMPVKRAQGAALTALSDTMSRVAVNVASSHVIKFTTPTGANEATDTIIITFPSDFNFTSKAISSVTFTHGASTGAEATETLAATPSATAWGAVFSGTQNRVLTLTAPSDGTGSAVLAPSDKVIITYDTTNSTNPSTPGSKAISITGTFGDTGQIAVAIVANDQVVVSATVDPTITFALSTNTASLGTLSSGAVSTASVIATTSTNSLSGYSTTVQENNNLRIDASNDIDDVADGAVTAGSEEYGIATSDSSQAISQDAACGSAPYTSSAITGSSQTLAGAATGPVTEAATICFAASITTNTVAGSYSHTLTFISTATF